MVIVTASDVSLVENLDELEVYGASENATGTTISSFVFEVSESPNNGFCGKSLDWINVLYKFNHCTYLEFKNKMFMYSYIAVNFSFPEKFDNAHKTISETFHNSVNLAKFLKSYESWGNKNRHYKEGTLQYFDWNTTNIYTD